MNKIVIAGIVFLLLGVTIIPPATTDHARVNPLTEHIDIATAHSNGDTLYVGGSGPDNYTTIQAAVDVASDGDTIFVYDDSSPYIGEVLIDKSIELVGEKRDTTVIEAVDNVAVWIDAENVTMSGFTVSVEEQELYDFGCGVYVDTYSDNATICNTRFVNNYTYVGVYSLSHYNTLSGNVFTEGGILMAGWAGHTIVNNTVNDKPIVYLDGGSDTVIDGAAGQVILANCNNVSIRNQNISGTCCAITLYASEHCMITNNSISRSVEAIVLEKSSQNVIRGNCIERNQYGIKVIRDSNRTTIENNLIANSSWYGIRLRTSGNTVRWNDFVNNKGGIYLDGTPKRNHIHHNNFIGNQQHAQFGYGVTVVVVPIIGGYLQNRWSGNYWSGHTGLCPKSISGEIEWYILTPLGVTVLWTPWMQFDWHPAREPIEWRST